MSRLRTIFAGIDRPLIAMAHVPALPGTPLYDPDGGIPRMVEAVAADVAVIVDAGFDGVLFCNENDRPYQLSAGLEAAAVMSQDRHRVPPRAGSRSASTTCGMLAARSRWPSAPRPTSCARSAPGYGSRTWAFCSRTPPRRCASAAGCAATTSPC